MKLTLQQDFDFFIGHWKVINRRLKKRLQNCTDWEIFEATQHMSDAELRDLQRMHDELERTAAAHDVDGYYKANHVFHSFVQQVANNRWLDRVTADLRKFVRMLRGRQLVFPGRIEASINEHRVLIAAMLARDSVRAERAMHDHLLAQLAALKALRKLEGEALRNAG